MSGSANKIWITEGPFLQSCQNLSSDFAKDCGENPRVDKHLPQSCPKLLCNDAKDSGKRPKQKRLRHGVACHVTLEIGNYTFQGMLTRIIALEETAGRLTIQDIKKAAESVEDTTPAKQSNNDGNGCTEACIVEQLEKKVMEKLGLKGDLFSKDPCFAVFDRSGKQVNLRCKRKCKCIVFSKAQNDQEAS